jgi:hypothetical protein
MRNLKDVDTSKLGKRMLRQAIVGLGIVYAIKGVAILCGL